MDCQGQSGAETTEIHLVGIVMAVVEILFVFVFVMTMVRDMMEQEQEGDKGEDGNDLILIVHGYQQHKVGHA